MKNVRKQDLARGRTQRDNTRNKDIKKRSYGSGVRGNSEMDEMVTDQGTQDQVDSVEVNGLGSDPLFDKYFFCGVDQKLSVSI